VRRGFFWRKSCIFSGVHSLEPRFVLLLAPPIPADVATERTSKMFPQLSPKVRGSLVLAVIFLRDNEKSGSGGKAKVGAPFVELSYCQFLTSHRPRTISDY